MCDTKLLSKDVFINLAEKSGLVYRDFQGSVLTPYRECTDLTEYLVKYSEKLLDQYGDKILSFETPVEDKEVAERIARQKFVADELLDKLELFDPSCVLAGGAPRDWFFNREASDLDVYFYFRGSGGTAGMVMDTLKKLFDTVTTVCPGDTKSLEIYESNPNIYRVFNMEYLGEKVQLIEWKEPTYKVVETFPLSICQAWYKYGYIRTTRLFDSSVENKALIKTSNLYGDGDKYINKIKGRFPEFNYFKDLDAYKRFIVRKEGIREMYNG